MFARHAVSLVAFFAAASAFAQGSSTALPATTLSAPAEGTTISQPWKVTAGMKSTSTSGRVHELRAETGRRYKMKNEVFASAVAAKGWGFTLMGVNSGTSYGDSSRTAFGAGDPSVTLLHPAFYEDANLKVTGSLRRYLAVTDRSKDRSLAQYAYYFNANYKIDGDWTLFNTFMPRYFDQSHYTVTDTQFLAEDFTTLTYRMNSWFKLGFGQHTQGEWHRGAPIGTAFDVYPFATFSYLSYLTVEPRLYLPIARRNTVYDSARAIALDNAQAEIYMSLSI